jgi:tRNA U34 5-methylaminomethyl-2-thiouridine-forming methyltransferase MnmC
MEHSNIQENVWRINSNGVLVTYAARGVVKQKYDRSGFRGSSPPGKEKCLGL